MTDCDPNAKEPTDYTGLKLAAVLAPLLLFFIYMGKPDMGLTIFIVLGMTSFALKTRWHLRKHTWFWAIVVFILALHVPLLLLVQWPQRDLPTIFYTMPLGIADFLIISKALELAERVFSKSPSSRHDLG